MTDKLKKLNEEMATKKLRVEQYERIIMKLIKEVIELDIEIKGL